MRDTQILGPHPTGIRNFPPLFAVKSDVRSRVDNPKLAFICFLMRLPNTVWLITSNAGRVDVRCFHFRLRLELHWATATEIQAIFLEIFREIHVAL